MEYPLNTESRPVLSEKQISDHLSFLKESFYKVDSKWPQFKIMFDEFENLSKKLDRKSKILVLERAYFYGGWSLFSPIFSRHHVLSIDCQINGQNSNFGKQESWLNDSRCIKWRPDFISEISNLSNIDNDDIDVVLIPNVIHHEKNQISTFNEVHRVLKKGGKCFIFEGLVRELHHLPDDYLRYTHEGLRVMLNNAGLNFDEVKFGSGVFDVLAYVWQQALDFFPESLRQKKSDWFYKEHLLELMDFDKKYRKNLVNPDKSFPMSYIVWGSKS